MNNLTPPSIGQRIYVVGISGSGKTTLARHIAGAFGIPHFELDNLYWKPGWEHPDKAEFRAKLAGTLSAPAWVIDGNYSSFRDIILPRVDTIIWVDFPRWRVMWQVTGRTIRRTFGKQELWEAGNVETIQQAFFSRESIIVWAWTQFNRSRKINTALFDDPQWAHIHKTRLKSPKESQHFIETLKQSKVNLSQ